MLSYPTHKALNTRFKKLSGTHTGLIRNFFVYNNARNNCMGMKIFTGNMPQYTKLTISPDHDMSYHISGYGNFYEEANIRFIGESVERYASVISHTYLKDFIIKGSASELKSKYNNVLPPEYINTYEPGQRAKLNKYNSKYSIVDYNENDIIEWIVANSFINENEKVLVPKGMFSVGDIPESIYMPAFTTGCACHETLIKAALNGLIEYFQIDAFMVNWYTDAPRKVIDIDSLPNYLKTALQNTMGKNYYDNYDILLIDYSQKCKADIPVLGVFIIAKSPGIYPAISFGVQSGFDLDNVIYRGVQEAFAVFQMNMHMPVSKDAIVKMARNPGNPFLDLDSNVQYYGLAENWQKNLDYIMKPVTGTISYNEFAAPFEKLRSYTTLEQIKDLISSLKMFSRYACYLNITPPNLDMDSGLYVMRTFVPELLPMSFPGFPYKRHIRYKEFGGRINEYPHPLP